MAKANGFSGTTAQPLWIANKRQVLLERIADLKNRVAGLQRPTPLDDQRELAATLQELESTLEELQVANEELLQQTEELATAHQKVEEERWRYQDLFDFAPDAYLVTSINGTIQQANRAAVALFDVPQDYLVGKPLIVFVDRGDRHSFHTWLAQLVEEAVAPRPAPTVYQSELRLQRYNGEPFPAMLSMAVVADPQTRSSSLRWLVRDITERKQAQEALQQSEARLRAVLESALDAIISMDHQGKIVEFNPAAEKMFGYLRSEALGRPLAELIVPPSLRDQHRRGLADYLATGEGRVIGKRIEMPALRADGVQFPVELAITRVTSDEAPLFTGYIRDISERKRSEETIRALSTPILQIRDRLLLLPIVGVIDPQRAAQLTDQLLSAIRSQRARVVVIDITGVAFIDSLLASHLIKTMEAARLLGAMVIVTGISPEMAQALVKLGVDLSALGAAVGDLRSGIEEAERLLGY